MLPNFEITNFRTFKHLRVRRLGQVNLILGKNNVGKTTLLEALRLYGSLWPARTAARILNDRDEVVGEPDKAAMALLMLHTMFHGREAREGTVAILGPIAETSAAARLRISAVFKQDVEREAWLGMGPQGPFVPDLRLVLRLESAGRSFELFANGNVQYEIPSGDVKPPDMDPSPPFIRGAIDSTMTAETAARWDAIALTPEGFHTIKALKLVAPITGMTFVADPRGPGRIAKFSTDPLGEPSPVASFGDGMVRVFQIGVALPYAARIGKRDNGTKLPANVTPMALIDEIDMGIHHTLHADLWRFVLKAASQLGVQVFATTHSWDCLRGFAEAIEDVPDCDALAIRLEKVEGKERTGAVIIDREDLPIVIRDAIEVR